MSEWKREMNEGRIHHSFEHFHHIRLHLRKVRTINSCRMQTNTKKYRRLDPRRKAFKCSSFSIFRVVRKWFASPSCNSQVPEFVSGPWELKKSFFRHKILQKPMKMVLPNLIQRTPQWLWALSCLKVQKKMWCCSGASSWTTDEDILTKDLCPFSIDDFKHGF